MVQRIKPVLLMSPISIAQYLPPGAAEFDLLVIDEASQVRPEEALGAMAALPMIDVFAKFLGQQGIPVLQIGNGEGERFLPESNAACWYLAHGSALIPEDRFAQADMLRWMFFEQYNHEPNVATLRFWLHFVGEANLSAEQRGQMMAKRMAGCAALDLMNRHLAGTPFFCGDAVTLADIALFPYTHVAEEGGFGLGDYPHIQRWIARVEALPGFVPMQ